MGLGTGLGWGTSWSPEVRGVRPRYLGLVALAVGLLCAGLLAAWAAAVPQWGSTTLRDVVLRHLRDEGDPVPSAMRYVRIAGTGGTPLYEVVLVGHFTAKVESRPLGAAVPTGTTLILYVEADNGAVTGMSLSNRPAPELAQLGHVRAVPL